MPLEDVKHPFPCMRDREIVELVPDPQSVIGYICPHSEGDHIDCQWMAPCNQCMGFMFAKMVPIEGI